MPIIIRGEAEKHRDRFGRLLVVLSLLFLAGGLSPGWGVRLFVSVLYVAAVVIAARATGFPRGIPPKVIVPLLLFLSIGTLVFAFSDNRTFRRFGVICAAIVVAGLLEAVLDRILRHDDVQVQTIAGALCAYLLFGLLFSSIYALFDSFETTPFFSQKMTNADYGYFSMSTLTSLGYGDITIVDSFGRRLAMAEVITGQVFLATAVARLVSTARRKRADDDPVGSADEATDAVGDED